LGSICFHENGSTRPGQEEGNVDFVQDAGFGMYCSDPAKIATIIQSWLVSDTSDDNDAEKENDKSNSSRLKLMSMAALAAARPTATLDIARDMAEYIIQHRRGKV
jgi:hypothetical protein